MKKIHILILMSGVLMAGIVYAHDERTPYKESDVHDPSPRKHIYDDLVTVALGEEDQDHIEGDLELEAGVTVKVRAYFHPDDEEQLTHAELFDLATGKMIRRIYYRADGETHDRLEHYDPATGKLVKSIYYDSTGKVIREEKF